MDVPKIFGRYQPINVLGTGGGSRVMLVKDLLDGEVRALKVLLDESAAEGFVKEYELLASLDHPQIVKVYDFGQDGSGLRYFTMEYLQGQPLTATVAAHPEPSQVQDIAHQLLSALASIHARGILHADLKPHNMFLVEGDQGRPHLKLLDFGLAGSRKEKQGSQRRGTLPYMAPEWFTDRDVDFRSDLYSAGVLLFELLTGKPPTTGDTPQEIIQRKLSDDVPDVAGLRKDCPAPLARLINSLLEREATLRPRSAEEALQILEGTPRGGTDGVIHLSSLPLVGRERFMASSRGLLETVITSYSGAMQFLVADLGGGRTRVLRELKSMLQREGHRVIEARGVDTNGRSPLAQIFFRPYRLEAEVNKQLIARHETALQTLLDTSTQPRDANRDNPVNVLSPQQRTGVVDSLASFLLELASRHPFMLLFDDLHLADTLVQELFLQLGRRISQSPLLVYATVEAGWMDGRPEFLGLMERPEVSQVRLDPLSRDEIGQLVKEMFDLSTERGWLSGLLHDVTAGNPALLNDALESLVAANGLRSDRGRWFVSEAGCHEILQSPTGQNRTVTLLQRRLQSLTPLERGLLDAASVLGKELDEPSLLGLVGQASWARDALENLLLKSLLIRDAEDLENLYFAQGRLQEYVLQEIPVEERRALHRRAGELLLASCGSDVAHPERLTDERVEQLARHFLAAFDLQAGRTYGLLAAQRAEQHNAWRQATEWYLQLRALAEQLHLPVPLDVSLRAGELYLNSGQLEPARTMLEPLLDLVPTPQQVWITSEVDEVGFRAWTCILLGAVYRNMGKAGDALKALDRLLPSLPLENPLLHLQFLEDRAVTLALTTDYASALRSALEGLELTANASSPRLLPHKVKIYSQLSNACWFLQQLTEMDEYVKAGLALANEDTSGLLPPELYEFQRALGTLHMMRALPLQMRGELMESIQATLMALPFFEKIRDLNYMINCYNNLSVCYHQLGDWSEAIEYVERVRDLAERIQAERSLRYSYINLGFMYKDTGQLDKASHYLEQAIKLDQKLNYSRNSYIALGNLGEVRARQGNVAEAYRLYEQALQLAREHQAVSEIAENLRRMAELSLDENRLTRARREIHEGLEVARKGELKVEEANLLSIQGAEAAQRHLTDRALAGFRQAEEILKEHKAEIERARLKYRQGIAYSRLGFPSEAESALRLAEEIFRRMGAAWDLRRTREALNRLGGESAGGGLAFKKLQLLLDVTRTLGSELELEPLLNRMLERALELTQTERGYVILLDDKGTPNFYATRHIARDEIERGETAQISSTIIQRVVTEGRALAITNIDQELDLRAQASIVALGLRSIMCAPIKRGDKVLGVIYVDSSRITEGFYQADVSLLDALADAAAIALENAQLVTSLRRKTDLMSILAHEFRSPLTASITFTHQLLRDPHKLAPEHREGLEAILEQGYRLSRMINNILELARMEANKVEWWMEEVQLAQVLETTVRGLEPVAREKQVRILLKPIPARAVVYGNPDRLIQVCTNLLGNALKFTPERGTVEISADVAEGFRTLITRGGRPTHETWVARNLPNGRKISDSGQVMVRFADTGPGIPLEDLERIFGQFAQTGPTHMRSQGTGLGLTIAREIVTQHGGRLWAENAATGGAMFIFSLPLVVSG